MDFDSSSKFISSLGKFLQSLCNGYVEFDKGVEVIGHIYLSVDTGKKIDYILNEKVSKTHENSVTFVSNSYHAQPAEKPKPAPKPPKPSEQEKTSDPGGSGEGEIVILDESEQSSHSPHYGSSSNTQLHLHAGSSKRSYDQSFPQKSRPHPAKHSRHFVQNSNDAHETNSSHSDSNYLASQSLPSDSSIAATSGADISHHSQVFPQTSSSASSNPVSNIQNIKEEPSSGAHDYDVNVKQEYNDNVDQGEGEQEIYNDQDESAYYDYYDGSQADPKEMSYNQIQGQHYPGVPGASMHGGENNEPRHEDQCPVDHCQARHGFQRHRLKQHWAEKHKSTVLMFQCLHCSHGSKRQRDVRKHMMMVHGEKPHTRHTLEAKVMPNEHYIDPYPFTLDQVLSSIMGQRHL